MLRPYIGDAVAHIADIAAAVAHIADIAAAVARDASATRNDGNLDLIVAEICLYTFP